MSKIARIPVSNLPRGVPGFVKWARATHPDVYRAVGARLAMSNLRGLGITAPTADPVATAAANPSWGQTILSTFKELATVALPIYQQNKMFDLQLKRAQQGLAPLDTAAIQDSSALRVGVDSATRNTGLMIAGAAVLGLLGFALLRRR
jgi:hypothetical protein